MTAYQQPKAVRDIKVGDWVYLYGDVFADFYREDALLDIEYSKVIGLKWEFGGDYILMTYRLGTECEENKHIYKREGREDRQCIFPSGHHIRWVDMETLELDRASDLATK